MEQSGIPQHLKNKLRKKISGQRKLPSSLWKKTGQGVISRTQKGMFPRKRSQP